MQRSQFDHEFYGNLSRGVNGKMEIEGELRRSTISPLLPPIPSERFYSCQASYYPLIVRPLSKMYASPPRELLSLRFYRWPESEARRPSSCKIFQGTAWMEITFRIMHARYRNGGQLFSRCISSNSCVLEDAVDPVESKFLVPLKFSLLNLSMNRAKLHLV